MPLKWRSKAVPEHGHGPLIGPSAARQIPPSLQVVEVRIRAGELIDLVEFVMADGSTDDGGYPSSGGKPQPPFALAAGETLVRLEARHRGGLIGVRLRTSAGRESPWYGRGDGGEVAVFEGSADDPIVGLRRSLMGGMCPNIIEAVRLADAE